MFNRLKKLIEYIKKLNLSIDKYKESTIIQSLPTVAYVNRAKKCLEENNLIEAETILLEALNLSEKDPLVYKYLGTVYDKKNEHSKAVEAYKKSAQICYTDKTIWQKLGFAQLACNDFEEAEKSFENADKISPANSDTFTGWGMTLMKQKKYEDAREKFVTASRINKYNFTSIFLAAVCEIKIGAHKDAEAKLTFLANVCPNETNTYEFANLKFIKKDYKNAKHYAMKSLEFNKNMLPSYLLLGKLYTVELDRDKALEMYSTAAKRELNNSNLYTEWGKSLLKFTNFDEAENKFVKALEYDGENSESMAYLALTRMLKHNDDEVLIQMAQDGGADSIIIDLIMAVREYNNGNYDGAAALFRKIETEDFEFLTTYFMAKINEVKKNKSKAVDFYEKSMNLNPYFLKCGLDYTRFLIADNEYSEAQRKLRKIVKIYNKDLEVLNLQFFVSYTLVKENVCEYNIKEAITLAEKIIQISDSGFEYHKEKEELENLLKNFKESE